MNNDDDLDISRVARASGLTSRTLRHFDAIGLLTPAWTTDDGRRYYSETELRRLQHILVLRELGTPLETIARILDSADPATTVTLLRDHLAAVESEAERYLTLADTVRRTITSLEEGTPMTADELFEGFDNSQYEPEARERWGDESVNRSNAMWKALGPAGQKAHLAEHVAIAKGVGAVAATDHPDPADPELQALVARHHAWISVFWSPGRDGYKAMGAMYVDDHRFRANYDKFGDGTAELLRDAISVWADANLT
jgi:DNA-binding transcriptional MerR regulator